jgi:hypothetical protein
MPSARSTLTTCSSSSNDVAGVAPPSRSSRHTRNLIAGRSCRRRGVATALHGGGGAWVGESGGALSSSTHTSTSAEARAFYGAIGCRELGLMLMKEL